MGSAGPVHPRPRRTGLLVSLVVLLVAAGCGSRRPKSDFDALVRAVPSGAPGAEAGAGPLAAGGPAVAGPAVVGSSASGGPAGAGASAADATTGAAAGGAGAAAVANPSGSSGPAGNASDVGVSADSILVGNITSVGGALGPDQFTPGYHGASAFFQALNARGGINGRKVRFVTCDDKENVDLDRQCAVSLIQSQKVFALVANNTRVYNGAAGYVNSQGVPDVGGEPIGNAYFKYPHLWGITGNFHYPRDGRNVGLNGTVYAQDGVYRYLKQKAGVQKAAVFFYTIAISRQAGLLVGDSLRRQGVDVVYYGGGSDQGENPAAPTYDTDVIQMRNRGVDNVWNTIDIGGFQKLCQSMDRFGFDVKVNATTIAGYGQLVGKLFSSPCRQSIYALAVSRSYADTSAPAVAEVRSTMSTYDSGYALHQWVVEGYAAAKMFTEGVTSLGAHVTRAGLEQWLRSLHDYTAGGLLAPTDYRWPFDYHQQTPSCFTAAQWQDSAGTFVTRSDEPYTCLTMPWVGYQPQDDGS